MNALVAADAAGELRVSSISVAERTENQHASVLRIVRDNQPDFEAFGDLRFEIQDRPRVPGPASQVVHLNEPQATLLMTYMRNSKVVKAFKIELVKQFYEMRQALGRLAVPQSLPEALRAYAVEVEAREVAEAKIALDAPKVEYVDQYVATEDLRLLRNVAKSIHVTEETLRTALIERKWIYEEVSERWSNAKQCKEKVRRYSPYSDKRDYFRPVPNHQAPRFKGEVMHTLKITPQGAQAIARAAERWGLLAVPS